jgi:hypothetical protein
MKKGTDVACAVAPMMPEGLPLECRYLNRLTSLFLFFTDVRKKDARAPEKPI